VEPAHRADRDHRDLSATRGPEHMAWSMTHA
jgi:hypothetical protein